MYKKGNVVLIPFPFTDLSGSKVRPAVVVSKNNSSGSDLVVVFVSSKNTKKFSEFDVFVKRSKQAGFKVDSVIKVEKIATLEKNIVFGELGEIDSQTQKEIDKKIKLLFGL